MSMLLINMIELIQQLASIPVCSDPILIMANPQLSHLCHYRSILLLVNNNAAASIVYCFIALLQLYCQ